VTADEACSRNSAARCYGVSCLILSFLYCGKKNEKYKKLSSWKTLGDGNPFEMELVAVIEVKAVTHKLENL